jgi:DNA mismatch endonuclease, patch repair protein
MPRENQDLATRLQRSRTMASIPSARTSLEQKLARSMWAAGLRGWRRTMKVERTRPDFAFPARKVALFVDGCFWHGCPRCCRRPESNATYWNSKLDRNIARDKEQTERLVRAQWTVIRLWGHEIENDAPGCARRVATTLMRVKAPSVGAGAHNGTHSQSG